MFSQLQNQRHSDNTLLKTHIKSSADLEQSMLTLENLNPDYLYMMGQFKSIQERVEMQNPYLFTGCHQNMLSHIAKPQSRLEFSQLVD